MKHHISIILLLCVSTLTYAQVRVLSLNNSLIDYNDQYLLFNNIASAMGQDATWTKHTNLGKTLDYHYDSDPLTPNALTVIASTSFTHIVLQEQSSRPITNYEAFRASVRRWVNYIRLHGANPEAVIILPVNWAYNTADSATYRTNNTQMMANYHAVANEFGLLLCPVADAYQRAVDTDAAYKSSLYTDDRHPTLMASYLAAVMEYSLIFGIDATTITQRPASLTDAQAAAMRGFAAAALSACEQYDGPIPTPDPDPEPEPEPAIVAVSLQRDVTYTQDFDALGGEDVNPATDAKTGILRPSYLPLGWRIDRNLTAPRTISTFASADTTLMYVGGQSLASNAYNGTWNLGATGSTDRAVGGLTTGIANGTRGVTVMVALRNNEPATLDSLSIIYDIEKYRNGNNTAGFTYALYYSTDGKVWTAASAQTTHAFAADAATAGAAVVPMATISDAITLHQSVAADQVLYLAWHCSVTSGTGCASAPCYALDNVVLTPHFAAPATALDQSTVTNQPSKILRNGHLLIRRGADTYDMWGWKVKSVQ